MGSEWPVVSLEAIAEVIDSRHKTPKYSDQGYPMVRVVDVKSGALDLGDTKKVTKEDYEDFSKGRDPQVGDLVISRVGSYGIVSYVASGEKFCLGQNTALIVPKGNSRFLYYQLVSPLLQMQIDQMAVGAVQKTISLKSIKQLQITQPPILEQERIANILGTLDDKIELNRQINATLEAMTQALFKSWFVDFDPVIDNALAAGNPIPDELQTRAEVRASLGDKRKLLPEAIQQQFPSNFVFSEEMGWIPEGWELAPVSQYAKLNPEGWTPKNHPEEVIYVDLANVKNGRINERVSYPFPEAPSRARRVLRKDDTIVGTVRPGNRSFAFVYEDGLTGSTGFAVLRPKQEWHRSYVYLALTRDEIIKLFAHLADGAAYPAIRPEVVANQLVIAPPDALLKVFETIAYPWMLSLGRRDMMSASLAQTRNSLLPKLLSGQLRIPDAEKLLDASLAEEPA